MKKIIISLSIMAMVAGVVIGATSAYFSDTETSTGNTFTAGTIDIKVDDTNPWTGTYSIPDIKPGETDYVNFGIENVGQNPAEIYKSIYGMVGTTGDTSFTCGSRQVSSQPECLAEGVTTSQDDIQTQIYYDLSVKIYESKGTYDADADPVWWQTIETGDETLVEVYGSNTGGAEINLGTLPVDGYMFVEQSYHFNKDAGNIYQGDVLTFDMKIEARQLAQGVDGNATVILENKTAAPEYAVIADTYQGTLTYKTKNPTFDFSFTGTAPKNVNYTLVIGTNPWESPSTACVLGAENFSNSVSTTFSGTATCSSMSSAKAWLVPTTDWNTWSGSTKSWNQSNYLLEVGLVNYTQN